MELGSLYEEVILDHNRAPRNWGELPDASRSVRAHNPLCGDQLTLWLKLDGDVIEDVHFVGEGCAISRASASMMTQSVKGKTRAEAEALFDDFHALVTGRTDPSSVPASLGRLRAFAGVSRYPTRVKCASMAWHALKSALEGRETVE